MGNSPDDSSSPRKVERPESGQNGGQSGKFVSEDDFEALCNSLTFADTPSLEVGNAFSARNFGDAVVLDEHALARRDHIPADEQRSIDLLRYTQGKFGEIVEELNDHMARSYGARSLTVQTIDARSTATSDVLLVTLSDSPGVPVLPPWHLLNPEAPKPPELSRGDSSSSTERKLQLRVAEGLDIHKHPLERFLRHDTKGNDNCVGVELQHVTQGFDEPFKAKVIFPKEAWKQALGHLVSNLEALRPEFSRLSPPAEEDVEQRAIQSLKLGTRVNHQSLEEGTDVSLARLFENIDSHLAGEVYLYMYQLVEKHGDAKLLNGAGDVERTDDSVGLTIQAGSELHRVRIIRSEREGIAEFVVPGGKAEEKAA